MWQGPPHLSGPDTTPYSCHVSRSSQSRGRGNTEEQRKRLNDLKLHDLRSPRDGLPSLFGYGVHSLNLTTQSGRAANYSFERGPSPAPPPLPPCSTAIPRAERWCRHRPLALGQSGWGVYVCPGCHFNTGNPPSPTQVLKEIAQRQSEWRRGLWGRDTGSCLTVLHTPTYPTLGPSLYLPRSDA